MSENPSASLPAGPRILILGSQGQLGRELIRGFAGLGSITALDRSSLDLAEPDQIRAAMRQYEPELILNAVAYTAVDRAESEPDRAFAINAEAPRILAEEARQLGALLVHYSTDYVFDGTKPEPWIETDPTHPLNVYGASKLAGEVAIQSEGGRYLIFRTSWVYGPHGKNFLLTMLRLGRERDRLTIVDDQRGAPTTSMALANATWEVVAGIVDGRFGAWQAWAGLYHMTCSGSTSWFGFAQAIFARARAKLGLKTPQILPLTTAEYPTPAVRPSNSVLSNAKLQASFQVRLPDWKAALDEVFEALSRTSAANSPA
jgi:dTDP-4-dehydrorhamnose reductase